MYLRHLKRCSSTLRIRVLKISLVSTLAAILVFYVSASTDHIGDYLREEDNFADDEIQVAARKSPAKQTKVGSLNSDEILLDGRNSPSIPVVSWMTKKDAAGEWFERPMILREPSIKSVIFTKWRETPVLNLISIDFKIGPIFAIKHTLQQLDVRVIDKSLSVHCHSVDTCADFGISRTNLDDQLSDDDILRFWKRHKNEEDFLNADGFICIYPLSLCELIVPFEKPVILVVDGRYEYGRTRKPAWKRWSHVFTALAEHPDNIALATNIYDEQYVQYFTKVNLPVVPYACSYVNKHYNPRLPSYLLMPVKRAGFESDILERFAREIMTHGMKGRLENVLDLYGDAYTTDQLRRHAGLVVIPHQVSFLAMTEILRLNIPIYMPSVDLLARWQADTHLMALSVHKHKHGKPASILEGEHWDGIPDPNEDKAWSIGFWLTYSEFFSWPGIKFFDSVEDLAIKINGTTGEDLFYNSQKASVFNKQEVHHVEHFWQTAVDKLKGTKPNKDDFT